MKRKTQKWSNNFISINYQRRIMENVKVNCFFNFFIQILIWTNVIGCICHLYIHQSISSTQYGLYNRNFLLRVFIFFFWSCPLPRLFEFYFGSVKFSVFPMPPGRRCTNDDDRQGVPTIDPNVVTDTRLGQPFWGMGRGRVGWWTQCVL